MKHKIIIGLDEVGRGTLAGPVTACAITINPKHNPPIGGQNVKSQPKVQSLLRGIKDSKKLNIKRREEVYKILKDHSQVNWGIGRVSEKVIDKINIFQATKLSMIRAVRNLERKINKKADFLLIDGNFTLPRYSCTIPQKSIIKGDEKVFLIKIASIVAKVTRDRAMLRYHKKYSKYRFDKHKGYGTKLHFEMLKKYGPCRIHRKTFSPMKSQ